MTRVAVLAALTVGLALAAPLAAAAPAITPTSIAGARLGWTQAHYRATLGAPGRVDQLEGGLVRLAYPGRRLEVTLHANHGVAIATWNKRLRDASGIGPCSAIAAAQKAYGAAWTKLTGGPDLQLWQARTLTFRIGKGRILAVVLATKPYRLEIAGNAQDCGSS